MKGHLVVLSLSILIIADVKSQHSNLSIIPEPYQVTVNQGNYVINKDVKIVLQNSFSNPMREAKRIQIILEEFAGIKIEISTDAVDYSKNQIRLIEDHQIKNTEGYLLHIEKRGITLKAPSSQGLFYACQTLQQLFPVSLEGKETKILPYCTIEDFPRFSFRALMVDPARHFLPVDDLIRYIETMAMYKFNKLHIHLTDDQGWRIEIKRYPQLTEIGSWRSETEGDGKKHGGYYTQDQLKELVEYAKAHFIEMIPEIEMPGHSMAALAAYPELACFPDAFEVRTSMGIEKNLICAGDENVYNFYDDVFKELATIFPYPEIHLGGDEAPTDKWEVCPKCQNTMKLNGLENEHDLMVYFFKRINDLLTKYDRKPLLWYEETVSHYPEGSTVYLWRNGTAERVLQATREKGLQLICSPGEHSYFDYPQSKGDKMYLPDWMPILTLEQVYDFDPGYGLSKNKQNHIIGVEACLWGENIKDIDGLFYMTFPRAFALSEAGWSAMENRSWDSFSKKLNKNLMFLLERGVNFRPPVELYKNIPLPLEQ